MLLPIKVRIILEVWRYKLTHNHYQYSSINTIATDTVAEMMRQIWLPNSRCRLFKAAHKIFNGP